MTCPGHSAKGLQSKLQPSLWGSWLGFLASLQSCSAWPVSGCRYLPCEALCPGSEVPLALTSVTPVMLRSFGEESKKQSSEKSFAVMCVERVKLTLPSLAHL